MGAIIPRVGFANPGLCDESPMGIVDGGRVTCATKSHGDFTGPLAFVCAHAVLPSLRQRRCVSKPRVGEAYPGYVAHDFRLRQRRCIVMRCRHVAPVGARRGARKSGATNFPGLRFPHQARGEEDSSHRVHRGVVTPWRQRRGDPRNLTSGFFAGFGGLRGNFRVVPQSDLGSRPV